LDEAALAELDRLEELARAEAEAAAEAEAGGKKGKKGKKGKGKGKDTKAPKKSEAQELAKLLESRVFVPLEPVSAKVSSARIQSMSKPIPGGALEKQLARLQAKRPNHWQVYIYMHLQRPVPPNRCDLVCAGQATGRLLASSHHGLNLRP